MRGWSIGILFLISCCYSLFVFAESKTVVLATADWQPYVNKEYPEQGEFTQIVFKVFEAMGIKVQFVYAPWKRVEAIVKSGAAFAGIPYAYTDKRAEDFDYSVPLMDSSYVFFYNKKAYPQGIHYKELAELARYRVGGVIGYWYDDLFKQANLQVEYVSSDEQGIKKLHAQRIDLAASDQLVGRMLIAELYPNEIDQFGEVEKPFAHQCLHLMVSRRYPDAKQLTQTFNTTFRALYAEQANAGCKRD